MGEISRGDIFRAAAAGKRAYEVGLLPAVCPHSWQDSPLLARGWARGYVLAQDAKDRAAGRPTLAERALIDELAEAPDALPRECRFPTQGSVGRWP